MGKKFEISRYEAGMKHEWDEFVSLSRNSTFLFQRDYMDYHADRFKDCSWVAHKKGRIVALLPANITEDKVLHSHQGLTYGGWILPTSHIDGEDMLDIFSEGIQTWKKLNITALDYKALPFIYAKQPSQDDLYALFRLGAEISGTNLSMAIDYNSPGLYNKLRKRILQKTSDIMNEVAELVEIEPFMDVLSRCLAERYDATPVHTLEELRLLKSRFPDRIRFFGVPSCKDDGLAAAVCIFDTGTVAHAQYIATTEEGRKGNYLTPLFTRLIRNEFADCDYFDFGTSNEDNGKYLNTGLLRQKASFGATGVAYTRYYLKF